MKAVILQESGKIEIKDVKEPQILKGDILLKTKYAAICHTDIKILTGKKKVKYLSFPRILGHEFIGEVVEKGESHTRFNMGDLIIPYPGIFCGKCEYCLSGNHNLCQNMEALGYNLDGGFAEYVRLPQSIFDNNRSRVFKISSEFSPRTACLLEPVSCCFNAMKQSNVKEGDTVLIIGLGFMGLIMVQMARIFGATRVIGSDPIEFRRSKARELGADSVLDPTEENYKEKIKDLTYGQGAEVVIVALDNPRISEEALQFVKAGGSLNLFGGTPHGSQICIDPNIIHYKQVNLVGTSGYRLQDTNKVLKIIEKNVINVESLITGIYPLDRFKEALENVINYKDIKAVISFN